MIKSFPPSSLSSNFREISGGVCVYVNTSEARTIEQIELDNDIEAIWLKITVENIQKPIIVASIYRPPNNPIDPFLSSLDRCLRRTDRLHEHYTLLAGDFNARNSCWYGGDTRDDAGENLHQLFSLFSLEQLNHFPTNLYADQLKSCLDLVSTNIPVTGTVIIPENKEKNREHEHKLYVI